MAPVLFGAPFAVGALNHNSDVPRRYSAVDLATMSDLDHENGPFSVVDRIQNAEVTLANAVLIVAGQLLTAWRTRLSGQLSDSSNKP